MSKAYRRPEFDDSDHSFGYELNEQRERKYQSRVRRNRRLNKMWSREDW